MKQITKSKISLLRTFITLILLSTSAIIMACEIEIKVSEKNQKESYNAGDELVLEVKVILTHRDCKVDISKTKFIPTGCKITGATKWSQSSSNTYLRKLKVIITDDNSSDIKLLCQRSCDKEGGLGKITLKRE